MEPVEFLRAHPPFERLRPEQLRAIEAGLEITYQPRGTVVLRQGGPQSRYLYIVRKGGVRLEREGRAEQVIEVGECFGFPSLIGHASPHADAVAIEDTLLYQLPAVLFDRLMESPPFSEFFLLDLSERLRRASSAEPLAFGGDLALPARHLARAKVSWIPPYLTVGEAARRMRDGRMSSLLVDGEPPGILTDRDLRNKVLASGRGPETPVAEVASSPLRSLPADATMFEVLVFMIEHDVHHVPLSDGTDVVGILTNTDLLRLQGRSPLGVRATLDGPDAEAALAGYGAEIVATVAALSAGGLEASKIGRIVARLNDALVARLLRRAESELGPPPVPYAWIVYGSEGRMEQALLTDQDNALVYRDLGSDADPEDAREVEEYFRDLAQRVVDGLVEASFPPCPGGFMATNWRKPLAAWVGLFRRWIETPDAAALLDVSSLLDFRPVHGLLDLAPLEAVVRSAGERRVFLAHLARTALAFEPPLSPFRQIREQDGGVDLKRGGLLPIVGMARVFALEAGSRARSTLDRLGAASAAGTLSDEGAATLAEAFRFLLSLRLRAQLLAARTGAPGGNLVRSAELSALERRLLRDTLIAVRELQQATALRFHTERLG